MITRRNVWILAKFYAWIYTLYVLRAVAMGGAREKGEVEPPVPPQNSKASEEGHLIPSSFSRLATILVLSSVIPIKAKLNKFADECTYPRMQSLFSYHHSYSCNNTVTNIIHPMPCLECFFLCILKNNVYCCSLSFPMKYPGNLVSQ